MISFSIFRFALADEQSEHESSQSRKYYMRFVHWCEQEGIVASADLLPDWDVKHNHSRIRALFGTNQDVYRVGLIHLYTRFFNSHSLLRVENPKTGRKVVMLRFRHAGPMRLKADMASDATSTDELEFVRAKGEADREECG